MRRTPTDTRRSRLARALLASALVAALAGVATCVILAAAPRPARAAEPPSRLVVILLSPYLTWSDVSAKATPALWSLAEHGAVGNMNSRTADPGWPNAAGGALTISASRWAAAPTTGPVDAAHLDTIRAFNTGSLAPPALGALGDAIRAAQGRTAAVGCGDLGTEAAGAGSAAAGTVRRPAELVATNASGTLDLASTSRSLTASDASAPFGLRSDPTRLRSALASAFALLGSSPSPSLLVVDPGDLDRAHEDTALPTGATTSAHLTAVAGLDSVAADVRRWLPQDALLLVVTPATDKPWYQEPQLGPTIAFGRGFLGGLRSASTHRDGLATSIDVAPTVLAALGLHATSPMVGLPMTARPTAAPLAARIAALRRSNATVGAVDQLRDAWFIRYYVVFALAVFALATALVWRADSRGRTLSRTLLLLLLATPSAGWLMFVVQGALTSPVEALGAFVLAMAFVLAAALWLQRRFPRSPLLAPIALAALTSAAILADQWLGHPIESGLFSYSIRSGWRYYGMGNEGAALLVGASLAATGLGIDALAGSRLQRPLQRFGVPVVGVIVLVTAAAPFAGANAGVAVWGVVACAVAWGAMNGVRLSWRAALLTMLAVVLAVAAFAAIDLASARGSETHLARFASGILRGDVGATVELISRKLANNLGYIRETPYTPLLAGFVVLLALLRFDRRRDLKRALASAPAYAAALLGVGIGGLVAMATEDSGVVMPALMLLSGATPALLLALAGDGSRGDSPAAGAPVRAPSSPAPTRDLVGAVASRD